MSVSPRQLTKDPATKAAKLASLVGIETAIDRLIAKHSNTNKKTLRTLASSKDKTTQKYVMSNPGTPHDVLFKMANQFPEQLLKNPDFDFVLLGNPLLLDIYTPHVLSRLVKHNYCPVTFLEAAAGTEDTSVARALLMNPQTPQSAIDNMRDNYRTLNITYEELELHVNSNVVERRSWNKQFQEYVNEYPWYAGRNIDELNLFLSSSFPRWVKPAIVRNLPGEIVCGLAGNTGIMWDILEILAECREREGIDGTYFKFSEYCGFTGWNIDQVMSRIASNPALPSKFISKWAKELPEYDPLSGLSH